MFNRIISLWCLTLVFVLGFDSTVLAGRKVRKKSALQQVLQESRKTARDERARREELAQQEEQLVHQALEQSARESAAKEKTLEEDDFDSGGEEDDQEDKEKDAHRKKRGRQEDEGDAEFAAAIAAATAASVAVLDPCARFYAEHGAEVEDKQVLVAQCDEHGKTLTFNLPQPGEVSIIQVPGLYQFYEALRTRPGYGTNFGNMCALYALHNARLYEHFRACDFLTVVNDRRLFDHDLPAMQAALTDIRHGREDKLVDDNEIMQLVQKLGFMAGIKNQVIVGSLAQHGQQWSFLDGTGKLAHDMDGTIVRAMVGAVCDGRLPYGLVILGTTVVPSEHVPEDFTGAMSHWILLIVKRGEIVAIDSACQRRLHDARVVEFYNRFVR